MFFTQAQNLPIYDDVEGYPRLSSILQPVRGLLWIMTVYVTIRFKGMPLKTREPAAFITFDFEEVGIGYDVGSPSGGQVLHLFRCPEWRFV